MNIYPAIDMKDGRCVRLLQGRYDAVTTYAEDPLVIAHRWQEAGGKWLHIVDLDGAKDGKASELNRAALRRILKEVPLPVQFGGGVRSVEIVRELLEMGVTRTVLGTAVVRNPALAEEVFSLFGERVAVGVDARNGVVAVQGWQEESGERATDFVQRMAGLGAKRFIFTDIAKDGMLQGINAEALEAVARAVPEIPIIASGGVTSMEDIERLLRLKREALPNLDGAIIGKALYTGNLDLAEVMRHVEEI